MAPRGHLTDKAYQLVLQRLRDGDYASGQRISAEDLVMELGASRQPVMDALKRLATEGFLDIIPQVGIQVIVPPRDDFIDFYRLLASVEGLCAGLAAERANASEAKRLAEINTEFRMLVQRGANGDRDAADYRAVNFAFHSQVVVLAKSAILADYTQGLWARSDFYISTATGSKLFTDRLHDSLEEHDAIYRAIAAKDSIAARQAMEQHIQAFILSLPKIW